MLRHEQSVNHISLIKQANMLGLDVMHAVYIAKLCAYLSSSFPALASTLGTRLSITVAGPALYIAVSFSIYVS